MKIIHYLYPLAVLCSLLYCENILAQCCGGGSGSPIAGGSAQGVLPENQIEINSNFQYINTNKFFTGDSPDTNFLDNFNSRYIYSRLAYGLSKKLTLSVESGYWINKTQVGLNKSDTVSSEGPGDLIIFPRYNIVSILRNSKLFELTAGLGFKIPLGKYTDSTRRVEPYFNEVYYTTDPLSVIPSSGAHDLIFYLFINRSDNLKKLSFFANAIYIKKGWNPLGEKIGDYASVGLFASKTLFSKFNLTMQLKGEWVDQMKLNNYILLFAYPNYDPKATGLRKVFIVPQVSYNYKGKLNIYLSSEIPLYQYMFKTQIGSQYQFVFGVSYRFFVAKQGKAEGKSELEKHEITK